MGIYIFQPETACHNSDSRIFKLISSATTVELLVRPFVLLHTASAPIQLGQALEETSNHKNEPTASTDEMSANKLGEKYTRRPILPEIEIVNLPLADFHLSISAVAGDNNIEN